MRTLVLCLDRDDDIGRKAGIASPVIGRSANIEAATKLAVADPEDSDINTIFGGVQEYDRLSAAGTDVEIVCIAGDRDVGVVSDNKIALQIDDLLDGGEFWNVIFISDGAEDESVLPIIESRIKINSVKRIRVKQSESIESTYYLIKEVLSDPKIRGTIFIPIGLAFIVYAVSVVAEQPGLAVAGILGVVGTYLLYNGFGVGSSIDRYRETATDSLYRGRISFITYIAAIILGLIATVQGANACWDGMTGEIFPGYVLLSMIFVQASVWWYVSAGLFLGSGKIVDLRLEERAIGKAWAFPFFVASAGLLLWAASAYILTTTEYQQGYSIQDLILSIVGAIMIALSGIYVATKRYGERK
ncbi:MAG: hypothetical protein C4B59_09805 [Candidatus Methanogaster sp.]|uniref:Uncharacterized protein n=1 Tax=Candidatus Methanogaster sp. TaxID=3386292 RepID=A0AC61L1R7_9EURY|nr:MAG: hypothetical protein C4B59_09805 [ANME-2 cluster archaeon]